MKFARHRPAAVLSVFVVPSCRVLAFPLSYTPTVPAKTYISLIVISTSLFLLLVVFLAIKLVYMKHRRIGTIHAPPGTDRSIPTSSDLPSSTSGLEFRDKQGDRQRGLLVGCLGSPTWETNLTSKLSGAAWRREQGRRYQLHTGSTIRSLYSASTRSKSRDYSSSSRLTKSTALISCSRDADQRVLSPSSGPSQIPVARGGSCSTTLDSMQRNFSTDCHRCHLHCGDFSESHGVRSLGGGVPNVARRASPSSIRLVDGPSHSSQVEYSFLTGLPPNTAMLSPLMGTRDSFQLSRCSLKCNRKPVPPIPPLPSFLPFYLPKGPETMKSQPLQASEYLPSLRFSPLASATKVFYSQQQVVEKKAAISRVLDTDESKHDVYPRVSGSESTFSASSKTQQHASNTESLTGSSVVHTRFRRTNVKSNHKRLQSYKGLAIGGTSPQTTLVTSEAAAALSSLQRWSGIESMQTGVLRTPSGSSRNDSVVSNKPLKPCLRQNSVMPMALVCGPDFMLTPLLSETSTRWSAGDSLQTPIPDIDIGVLGLDRFRWNDENKELKVRSCHTKKDSIVLVPY